MLVKYLSNSNSICLFIFILFFYESCTGREARSTDERIALAMEMKSPWHFASPSSSHNLRFLQEFLWSLIMAVRALPSSLTGDDVSCYTPKLVAIEGVWQNVDPFDYDVPLFMIQVIIIVVASHGLNLLLRPFHQPRSISEVIVSLSAVRVCDCGGRLW